MTSRPRLLFLAQMLPYPPDAGVSIRTYNVLRLLAREYDVTALCFYRLAHHPTHDRLTSSIQALGRLARVRAFPIPQEHSRARLVVDHARSTLTGLPYTIFAYRSSRFRSHLTDVLHNERFDLAHVDSLDLADYLPLLRDLPVICVHHNVESDLLRRRGSTARQPARAYLNLQAHATEALERRFCAGLAMNVVVSPDDANRLREIAPDSKVTVIPNGVDTAAFRPDATGDQDGLVFVGGHSWPPNREAMSYFCREILPHMWRNGLRPRVTWVGNATDAAKREYETKYDVRMTGYVDDIRPFVHAAACYIVPLRAGGGTRLKILDAWAMGKAVVSTTVGCEGLDARDGDNILIRDTPEAFAAAVRSIVTDGDLRERLSAAARRTAVETYDWEVLGRAMLAMYDGIARSASRARGRSETD